LILLFFSKKTRTNLSQKIFSFQKKKILFSPTKTPSVERKHILFIWKKEYLLLPEERRSSSSRKEDLVLLEKDDLLLPEEDILLPEAECRYTNAHAGAPTNNQLIVWIIQSSVNYFDDRLTIRNNQYSVKWLIKSFEI
jgi:hypothetical protein